MTEASLEGNVAAYLW